MQSKRIAIVGAGLSGLAAAHALGEAGFEVSVFEKSRGLSGRAASRTREGCRYDIGANYMKVESNEVARLLFQTLPTEGLCRIPGAVLAFDRDGVVLPETGGGRSPSRWTYREGISTLGKLLASTGRFSVLNGSRVSRLERSRGTWQVETEDGGGGEGFAALLLTPPAPQTAELLEASDLPEPPRSALIEELGGVRYASQFSVALNFEGRLALPGDAYALVNADRGHDAAWVSHENRKPGRIPEGESLFVVQLSPAWTRRHYEVAAAGVADRAAAVVAELLGRGLPPPRWSDVQRWRYALPLEAAETRAMKRAADCGLYFAGDCLVGSGRIGGAIETGLAAAVAMGAELA